MERLREIATDATDGINSLLDSPLRPEQAEEVHADLRRMLESRYNPEVASQVRIQYGGSVKPDNAGELLQQAQAATPLERAVKTVFLRVLARNPTGDELSAAATHIESSEDVEDAWIDTIWALINTREFLTNK